MKKLVLIVLVLLVVGIPPVISLAGELEDAQERVRLNPNDALAHYELGSVYYGLNQHREAIASYQESVRIRPSESAKYNLKLLYDHFKKAITSYKKAIIERNFDPKTREDAEKLKYERQLNYVKLGIAYETLGDNDAAIATYEEALREYPSNSSARNELKSLRKRIEQEALAHKRHKDERKDLVSTQTNNEAEKIKHERQLLAEERRGLESFRNSKESDQLSQLASRFEKIIDEEKRKLESEREKLESLRLAEEKRQRQAQAEKESTPHQKQTPQSGTGSGFFVSKMGHVITNAHVVKGCNKVTVGDNATKQVPAEVVNTDGSNDLALLKLSSLEMASSESKSLIQKLSIVVVPLASKGLLRSEDVKLGEKVLVAGYPFGDIFSNTIKVTAGIVSATRGAGDDSGQFQLDAAVQPGNSGGPIYDSGGNIVGVVISQLDKLKVAKAIGSLPENVNFGIKASTVRQFLISSGLPSKKAIQTDEKSTEQLAEIAQNQALMVMCLQSE